MRRNLLSRRSVVVAIVLVAMFLLLALVVTGCTTQGAITYDNDISGVRVQ